MTGRYGMVRGARARPSTPYWHGFSLCMRKDLNVGRLKNKAVNIATMSPWFMMRVFGREDKTRAAADIKRILRMAKDVPLSVRDRAMTFTSH